MRNVVRRGERTDIVPVPAMAPLEHAQAAAELAAYPSATLPFAAGATRRGERVRCELRSAETPLEAERVFAALGALVSRYTGSLRLRLDRIDERGTRSVGFDLGADPSISALVTCLEHLPQVAADGTALAFATTAARGIDHAPYDAVISYAADGTLSFDADGGVFDRDAASVVLRHLSNLARAADAAPDAPVSALAFLDEAERNRLLALNDTARAFRDVPPIALFDDMVAAHPAAVALVVGERRYTYAQLAAKARRLANYLVARGVGPGRLVGLCLRRDVDLIVAVLAVAASGAAYVPLDPRNPAPRQAQILEDAPLDVILAEPEFAALFPAARERVVAPAQLDLGTFSETPLGVRARPEDLAYVIFTSGSTGRPKGVMIDNHAFAAFVAWTREGFDDDELSGVLCASSIAFDVSVFEIFAPLCHGGRVILVENVLALADAPARDDVRVVCSVASGLAELARDGGLPAGVRTVLQAGERLHASLALELMRDRELRLLNLCGGTEDTVYSVWHRVTPGPADPPIGRPFSNHTVYVVDAALQLVPAGVPGEICYGGQGVARGYINRPDQSAQRFVPNPFGDSERMYRSGDLVRWNARGEIEFLNRLDDQLKVRGHRVELAEIEHHLLDHPGVAQVLVAPFDSNGDTELAAYVVAAAPPAASAPAAERAETDVIAGWTAVYDELYAQTPPGIDPSDDFAGWIDSAGTPFPPAQMRAWADAIAARICTGSPQSVLELGCGKGLIALRVAPQVARYVATDFSSAAVARLNALTGELPQLTVAQLAADRLDLLPPETFDVVVLNSVVQYFPSLRYLESVIDAALARLNPGGRIVVGDVRNPRLARALHARIARLRMPSATPAEIDAEVGRRLAAPEEELLVDPSFFAGLARRDGAGLDVSLLAKEGGAPEELALFRYDVVLTAAPRAITDVLSLGFGDQLRSEAALGRLVELLPPPFALTGVPDSRLAAAGVDILALAAGMRSRGLEVEIAPHNATGDVDLIASAGPRDFTYVPAAFRGPAPVAPVRAAAAGTRSDRIDLRAFLAGRLPAYMIPASVVWLDAFPHNASGKIDRNALPDPIASRTSGERRHVAPRNAAERAVAAVWSEILGIATIGAEDDLFALGGHSLSAARIVARLRDRAPGLTLGKFFDEPSVAGVARYVNATAAVVPAPAAIPAVVEVPLSFAQETMWFLDRVLPDGAVYNIPAAWDVSGIDVDALQRALDALVARHDQFRTTFPDVAGQPVARTATAGSLPLRRARLDSAHELSAALVAELRRPFDLECGPLVRALLVEAGTRTALMLTFHHIVADGWARGIIAHDLYELYAAAHEGRAPALAPLPTQYRDFVFGERDAMDLYEADLRWWAEQLRDLPRFDIPGNRIPPAARTVRGGRIEQRLEPTLVGAIERYAKSNATTPFSTVLAAYTALLSRYSGESEIVIGTPLAGRRYPELERLVGNFIEMVTLRLNAEPGATFDELTRAARRVLFEALDHQAAPFRLVVERVASVRSQTQNPLFSVAIVAIDAVPARRVGGTTFAPFTVHNETSKFDLLLEVIFDEDGLTLGAEFARDRFDEPLVRSLLATFTRFIEAAVRAPQTALEDIPLAGPATAPGAERSALPAAASATAVNLRFRAHAAEQPDALAVRLDNMQMTYGQLRTRADRLRAHLAKTGVRHGDLVGLCGTPSCDLVAAMIAILDLGAAYVPLDPQYPAQRLAFIAANARLRFAVADEDGAQALASLNLTITPFAAAADADARAGAPVEVGAADAAYVIYTSGSTGNPKGVVVEHGNVARLFSAAGRRFSFGSRDVWTLFHSYAFDFSVWEIWGALAHGGTLVIVPPDLARSPREFHRLVAERGVTVLNQTPSAFYEFDAADAADPRPLALRYVVLGGEAVEMHRLAEWYRRHPDDLPQVINMYGITETTVHVTHQALSATALDAAFSPIGTPLDDLSIELLDRHGNVVPDGFVGEIHVLGAGVARGYLNNPHATASRFTNVVRNGIEQRSYRSGDLARRRDDGTYEYVARADQQVKVRGFRIEPGEIEAALATHPAVTRCVVLADKNGADTRLIAYVVPKDGTTRLPDLYGYCVPRLPHYMIPGAFIAVRALPLTTNGKLDRRALAALELPLEPIVSDGTAVAGISNLECELQALFAELLGVPQVGPEDSFFALGGHSLLAARLAARLEAKFPAAAERLRLRDGRGALLRVFYSRPTVRALAATLEGDHEDASPIVRMREGNPNKTPVFWLHGMYNGDGLYTWDIVSAMPDDVPFYVVHPHGYDNCTFAEDIRELARDHMALIREVQPRGPYVIGGFCNGALIAFEIAQQLCAAGETVDDVILVSLPPLYAGAERFHRFVRPLWDAVELDDAHRSSLLRVTRIFNDRLRRLGRGSWQDRLAMLRSFFRRGRRAVLDYGVLSQQETFADPGSKHVKYLNAIARYAIEPYRGRTTLIYGSDVAPSHDDFTRGWGRYLSDATLRTLPGGHFSVVDNAVSVGRLIARSSSRTGIERTTGGKNFSRTRDATHD